MRITLLCAARPRALSLALLLGVAACSDVPTASRPSPGLRHDGAPAAGTLHRPALIANHVKYRDTGYHPASGKAGSATLYLQALLSHDGKTEVQVATDPWAFLTGWAPGQIAQLQVKALGADGRVLGTRVHTSDLPGGGLATVTEGGMARGTTLQAQGIVRGIDGNRADVPVVTGTVRLRPNLAVKEIGVPGKVRAGTSFVVTAVVAETNGDLGEQSDCRLYVDGRSVDWAQQFWVDAGDAVTCLFIAGPLSAGQHQLEVLLGAGSPRDDDPADNSATAQVEAEASDELFYTAFVNSFEQTSHVLTRNTFITRDSAGVERRQLYEDVTDYTTQYNSVSLYGWTFRGLSRRPHVEIEEETNGARVFSAAYELGDIWGDPSQSCGYASDYSTGVTLFGCTRDGFTDLQYLRMATHVAYHSAVFSSIYDGYTGQEEQVYQYDYAFQYQDGLPQPEYGGDYTVRMRLDDGTSHLFAAPTFPLQAWEYHNDYPLTCITWEYPWVMFTNEYCTEQHYFSHGVSGGAQSYPY